MISGNSYKIGILHSLSGTMALSESPLVDAVQIAVEEINDSGGILGRRVETVVRDCASRPEIFHQNTLSMIENEGISTFFRMLDIIQPQVC